MGLILQFSVGNMTYCNKGKWNEENPRVVSLLMSRVCLTVSVLKTFRIWLISGELQGVEISPIQGVCFVGPKGS